jgi:hypothetical protein
MMRRDELVPLEAPNTHLRHYGRCETRNWYSASEYKQKIAEQNLTGRCGSWSCENAQELVRWVLAEQYCRNSVVFGKFFVRDDLQRPSRILVMP